MTGIDRLRTLAGAWDEWGLGGTLAEIADEIERELREERDAIAWVREHGGLDCVMHEWQSRVPRDRYELMRQRLLDHIAECETALGRRNRRIEELGHRVSDLTTENAELRKRAMPEGMEWPRYESGEFVKFGDELEHYEQGHRFMVDVVEFMGDGWRACYENDGVRDVYRHGERVKRPAPKVLDADGAEVEVGDDLYTVEGMLKFHVSAIDKKSGRIATEAMFALDKWADPKMYTHQRPVLDAEGDRIEPAMDVWWICEGDERGIHAEKLHVESIGEDGLVTCDPFNGGTWVELEPSELYVHKPVLGADGKPLREGDTVWFTTSGSKLRVDKIEHRPGGFWALELFVDGSKRNSAPASVLTHERPVLDAESARPAARGW